MPLMAQRQIELKELQPKAAEVIPVKVEMIDSQEVLTVSNYNHSIQIPLTAESKAEIDALPLQSLQSPYNQLTLNHLHNYRNINRSTVAA